MPKYTDDIIAGYTLYFTSKCVIEAMHVHASDKELSEYGSNITKTPPHVFLSTVGISYSGILCYVFP